MSCEMSSTDEMWWSKLTFGLIADYAYSRQTEAHSLIGCCCNGSPSQSAYWVPRQRTGVRAVIRAAAVAVAAQESLILGPVLHRIVKNVQVFLVLRPGQSLMLPCGGQKVRHKMPLTLNFSVQTSYTVLFTDLSVLCRIGWVWWVQILCWFMSYNS